MDLDKLLTILKEINAILALLRDLGLKIDGTLSLPTLLRLFHRE